MAAALTPASRRILRAVLDLTEPTLLWHRRGDVYSVGQHGPAARWAAYAALESAGLVTIHTGFAMAQRISATAAARTAA